MHQHESTEVLVVGAGPVGMLTALGLAENGVRVKIIDKEPRSATHSYACALHPQTMKLFHKLGLAAELLERGRAIKTMGFYDGNFRRAEINLSALAVDFPFLVVLPQNELEHLLETKLNSRARVQVEWNHRLAELKNDRQTAVATVERLGETGKGYSVASWDEVVEKRQEIKAEFVIGADGHNSAVRNFSGIEYERVGLPEQFEVYEFDSDASFEGEARIVLDEWTTNVLWPLSSHRCRWSFQRSLNEAANEFPPKDRATVTLENLETENEIRQHVKNFIDERAPWFAGKIGELKWFTDVQFEHGLAKQFGRGRCWLAGDAAHQTGPVGMQSLNSGLSEADELAGKLKQILRDHAPPSLLETYNQNRHSEWERLLGMKGSLTANATAENWVQERRTKILSCIPASGEDLTRLLGQIGLGFE